MSEVRKIWADGAIRSFYLCAKLYLANDRMFDGYVRKTLAFYGKTMFANENQARQVLKNCEDYLALRDSNMPSNQET